MPDIQALRRRAVLRGPKEGKWARVPWDTYAMLTRRSHPLHLIERRECDEHQGESLMRGLGIN
jgi:hypothetical protein